ncbi:MAG TPA: AcvB/VirJ family lysyl-phosphatidylglycerol hydrolase [Sphingobium sp.]|uniref:virulence factor family protein n=1 Tax=Sphingobium sp. TaxID=1912891 RepID=UPI002ED526DF
MARRRALAYIVFALILGLTAGRAQTPAPPRADMPDLSHYDAAPFGTIWVARPVTAPRGVALFLSDEKGVTGAEMAVTTSLVRQGMMVALISTPELMRNLDAGGACLNLNYPLIALSSDLQHRTAVRAYMKPVVMGLGTGGTLAYASLSQWAKASYAGVLSIGYRQSVATRKPWCAVPGFTAKRAADGWQFGANPQISLPWTVLLPGGGETPELTQLVAAIPHARLAAMAADRDSWQAPLIQAVEPMVPQLMAASDSGNPVPDMPLTLVEARPNPATSDLMAVMYSGDGGWVGIDHDVSGQLAAAGIPVVGVDSLSYFWTARTPEGASRDLGRLINAFGRQWGRSRVLLVGYSFGADVMPFMINGLDGATRAKIERVSLLGLSSSADFQFHMASWLNVSSDNALPTMPAVARLKGLPVMCVRGQEESDSACTDIPAGIAQQYLVPGDHHFNRNAPLLASIILGQRKAGTIAN